MANTMKLPVGIDDFRKLRESHFYYVDKTRLIEQLLLNWSEVTLFTRPRRFGKTLNMSMLKSFFDIGTDKILFDGLYISGNKELCDEYMGKYPVIFLSLKGVEGSTFDDARYMITEIIGKEAERFRFLERSEALSENDKDRYRAIISQCDGKYMMDAQLLVSSLKSLSQLLCTHYGQKTIILIDEYDVPLDKAFQNGYYKEMVSLIRGLFGQALKTNEFLQFAVLTGCLRISKESIFTGLNNFKVMSITDSRFDEQFGFTDSEVKKLLSDYGMDLHFDEVKEWYDGYHFGKADVYCPWDVINHVDHLRDDSDAKPQTYWINSSGNSLVRRLINRADSSTKDEIERLIAGEAIEKVIRQDLTYDEIENSIDNIWSVLFTTGYLTKIGEVKLPDSESYAYRLVIPNKEVREVFVLQIQEWFKAVVANDNDTMKLLSKAILDKDETILARQLNIVMGRMISILDTKAPDDMKENFYHGLLLGLLRGSNPDWLIKSNRESGDGFSDILIKPENPDLGIVIEVKYAKEFKELDAACNAAMAQIKQKRYDETLRDEGRCDILAYGIAFCRKRCRVAGEKL
ncbi:AAA family ATPase [Agathobacter sp.]|uniref:AAA family ATPase n=1 Tax=Agathobacter sp. TaxID=2021311 RepID=UPI003FD7D46E